LQGKAREGLLPRSQALPCPVLPAKTNYNHLRVKSQYPKLITGGKIRVWKRSPKLTDGTDGKKKRKN